MSEYNFGVWIRCSGDNSSPNNSLRQATIYELNPQKTSANTDLASPPEMEVTENAIGYNYAVKQAEEILAATVLDEPTEQHTESLGQGDLIYKLPHRWRRRLTGTILAIVATTGAGLTIPKSAPYHDQAKLSLDRANFAVDHALGAIFGSSADAASENRLEQSVSYLDSNFALDNGLNLKTNNWDSWYAAIWPDSRMIDALYLVSQTPGENDYVATCEKDLAAANNYYWDIHGYDQGLRAFHSDSTPPLDDDNLWMGLLDIRGCKIPGQPADLSRARAVFNIVMSQWDKNGGGIYWQEQLPAASDHSRAVVSNAPAIILAIDLYNHTDDPTKKTYYLEQAEKIYGWLMNTLYDNTNGLMNDHINADGSVDTAKWTYVQGVMAAAMAALAQVDPVKYPLKNAVDLADNALSYFQYYNSSDDTAFTAIFFEIMKQLAYEYNDLSFSDRVDQALQHAIAHAPKNPTKLLNAASKTALLALDKMPVNKANDLFWEISYNKIYQAPSS